MRDGNGEGLDSTGKGAERSERRNSGRSAFPVGAESCQDMNDLR